MELRQLRYFAAVARESSFSRAAQKLYVAQPAISRQVQMLEAELGVQLLIRTARGVEMTEVGRELQEKADFILGYIADLTPSLNESASEPSGSIVVGLPPSVVAALAMPLMDEMAKRHPKVRLNIVEGFSVFLSEWLVQSKLDLALLTDYGPIRGIERRNFVDEDLVLIGGPTLAEEFGSRALEPGDLLRFRLISSNGIKALVEPWLFSNNIEPEFEMELDSMPLIIELVQRGTYCAFIPYSLVADLVREGELITARFNTPPMKRRLVTAVHTNRELPSTVLVVEEVLTELVNNLPLAIED